MERTFITYGESYTHTSKVEQHKFNVPVRELDRVMVAVAQGRHSVVDLAEFFSAEYTPVLLDVDLRATDITASHLTSLVSREDVERLVVALHTELERMGANPTRPEQWATVWLAKPARQEQGVIKDGVHLHMPCFWIPRVALKHLSQQLRTWVERTEDIFPFHTHRRFSIVDDVSRKPWMMFGCHKEGGVAWRDVGFWMRDGVWRDRSQLPDLFGNRVWSCREETWVYPPHDCDPRVWWFSTCPLGRECYHVQVSVSSSAPDPVHSDEELEMAAGSLTEWVEALRHYYPDAKIVSHPQSVGEYCSVYFTTTLPCFFCGTVHTSNRHLLSLRIATGAVFFKCLSPQNKRVEFLRDETSPTSKKMEEKRADVSLEDALHLVAPYRVETASQWSVATACLHHLAQISVGDWTQWSLQFPYIREKQLSQMEMLRAFITMLEETEKDGLVGLSVDAWREVLERVFQASAPVSATVETAYRDHIERHLDMGKPAPLNIAWFVRSLYKHQIVSVGKGTWFVFHEDRGVWEEGMEDAQVHGMITDRAMTEFQRMRGRTENHETQETLKYCYGLCQRQTAAIITQLRCMCASATFRSNLNSQPVLGLGDGQVLDFGDGTGSPIRRVAKKEDYLTFSLGKSLVDRPADSDIRLFQRYFSRTIQQPRLREFCLYVMSYMLAAGNPLKHIYFFTGARGDNGKSMLMLILKRALGDYFVELEPSVISESKTASTSATPQMASTQGKRVVYIPEPSRNLRVNDANLKRWSGNDPFFARNLYENGHTITPLFKFIIVCNELPKSGNDTAYWNRIVAIPFLSRFVNPETAPPSVEQQKELGVFPRDPNLKDRLDGLASVLLWYMVRLHGSCVSYLQRPVPEEIRRTTTSYRMQSDFVFLVESLLVKSKKPDGYADLDLCLTRIEVSLGVLASRYCPGQTMEGFKTRFISNSLFEFGHGLREDGTECTCIMGYEFDEAKVASLLFCAEHEYPLSRMEQVRLHTNPPSLKTRAEIQREDAERYKQEMAEATIPWEMTDY